MPQKLLEHFAQHLLQANMISKVIAYSPTYNDIIKFFISALPFLKTVNDIERHCHKFTTSLEKLGGDGAIACSKSLREEWNTAAKSIEHNNFMSIGKC